MEVTMRLATLGFASCGTCTTWRDRTAGQWRQRSSRPVRQAADTNAFGCPTRVGGVRRQQRSAEESADPGKSLPMSRMWHSLPEPTFPAAVVDIPVAVAIVGS